ncbi:transglutaminase-like domain-containing protein [Paenibacillus sp. NEAU-GSW1]|uniref:transglutaminase-like domain-containing protein n=1 Tax=Paenibacillus sp. NEAU-GSW1 TaxID=2682486 RepID=UPI0012E2BADC|nr:transglutaminase-like domain-containing protein [Paenibacillus sp. NEAU-GSW1]MUT67653.1 transglutaminase domain-containing protein [Paenibacillus sp. NEAU-GSW1]
MRKLFLMLAAVFVLTTSIQVTTASANAEEKWLDTSKLNNGVVSVAYDVKSDVKTKVMITKGNEKYTYSLTDAKENFPLQLGNGDYTVSVLENTSGNKYKVVSKEEVSLELDDTNTVFLNSIQNVKWNSSNKAIQKAKELTANKKTDSEKVKAIYNYIVNNVSYDYDLAANLPTDYLPNIDRTLSSKKDICYGYSALFAAMLRSVDIPTKLVMGNTTYVKQYHAWNEVMLNGEWVIVDTTVDAGLKKANKKYEFAKEASKYTTAKEY